MDKELQERLKKGALSLGIEISPKEISRFALFSEELLEWNQRINLTRITEPDQIITKHFLDSLSIIKTGGIEGKASLIDVGSGAGFPGVPVKIVCEKLQVTFLDSLQKRLNFIQAAMESMQIDPQEYRCLHARAEEAGKEEPYRERFDFAAARAVSDLRGLSEYCLPFVKVGGCFLAMKGPDIAEELQASRNAIRKLGGEIERIEKLTLPDTDLVRTIVVIRKKGTTSKQYPRRKVIMDKNPL